MDKPPIRTLTYIYSLVLSILFITAFVVKDWNSMDFENIAEAVAFGIMGLIALAVFATYLVTFHLNLRVLADDFDELKLKTGSEKQNSMSNILAHGSGFLLCNAILVILILNLASMSGEVAYSTEWWMGFPVILVGLVASAHLAMLLPWARKVDAASQSKNINHQAR